MTVAISYFRHARDRQPIARRLSLDRLERLLTTRRVRRVSDKTELAAWSPVLYRAGTTRGKANVDHVSCLVLDYDDGKPWHEGSGVWDEWFHIVHTSWSHKLEHHKYRVVLPLARPVPAALWLRVFLWAQKRDPAIDGSCKDASRIYFLPATRSEDWPWLTYVEKSPRLLDLDARQLPPPPTPPKFLEPSRPMPLPRTGDEKRDLMALRFRLKNESGARRGVAGVVGAKVMGDPPRAEGAVCLQCKRPSVWFWINPGPASGAYCDHEQSCGWTGWLDELR